MSVAAREGWTNLNVSTQVGKDEEERINLNIQIEPGEYLRYSGIAFVELPPEMYLETQLLLIRNGIWKGARISLKDLSKIKDEIRSRLIRRGWIQARVNLPLVGVAPNLSQLTIRIEPGPRHLFTADKPLPKADKLLSLLDIYPMRMS